MSELIPPDMHDDARKLLHRLLPDNVIDEMPHDTYDDIAVELARRLRLAWMAGASAGLDRCKEILSAA